MKSILSVGLRRTLSGVRITPSCAGSIGIERPTDRHEPTQIAPEYGIGPNTRQCLNRGIKPADECYARKVCLHPPPRVAAHPMADVQKS